MGAAPGGHCLAMTHLQALADAIGARNVLRDPPDVAPYAIDWRGAYRGVPLAEAVQAAHNALGWAVVALLALHIGAAVFHQAIRRDGTLLRMV